MSNKIYMENIKLNTAYFLKNYWKHVLITIIGLILMGIGVAINNIAYFGNDAVSVLYDGVSRFFGIPLQNASLAINTCMVILAFIFAKKHVSVATVLYYLFLTPSIALGMISVCQWMFKVPEGTDPIIMEDMLKSSFYYVYPSLPYIFAIAGCFLMFTGLALFVALNIGTDPWTAFALRFSDMTTVIPFKWIKVICDVVCFLVGWMLGGKWGIVTILTALLGGPYIKWMSAVLCKTLLKWLQIKPYVSRLEAKKSAS